MSNTSLLGSYGGQGDSSLMFRNRIINGNFDIWQRGTTGAHTGNQIGSYVSADRWKLVGHQAGVSYLGASLERSTDVPSGGLYSAKAVSTAAGIDDVIVGQIIEGANTFDLVGKSITFSAQMKKLAALTGKTLTIEIGYLNTVDTTPTDWLNAGGITVVSSRIINSADFSTSWSQYTLTTGVLPAQAANGLVVRLCLRGNDLGSGDLFAFTGVQLEAGSVATPFERRPYSVELGMCERYFWKGTIMGTRADANWAIFPRHQNAAMRTIPVASGTVLENGATGTQITGFAALVSAGSGMWSNITSATNLPAAGGWVSCGVSLSAEL